MSAFLVSVLFLTYYSKQFFYNSLPTVSTVMPEIAEKLDNGRYSYTIPAGAVRKDIMGGVYVLVLKKVSDALGDHYYASRTDITILRFEGERAAVDGFVWIEPVICSDDEGVDDKTRVRLEM